MRRLGDRVFLEHWQETLSSSLLQSQVNLDPATVIRTTFHVRFEQSHIIHMIDTETDAYRRGIIVPYCNDAVSRRADASKQSHSIFVPR